MENWIIISKLIILLYCISKYIVNGAKDPAQVVAFILVYISSNAVYYMIKKDRFKEIFTFASIVLCVGYFQYVNVLFILLIPVNIFELIFTVSNNIWLIAVFTLVPVFFLKDEMLIEYAFISCLSFLIYMISYKYYSRVSMLVKEKDEMKEKIYELSGKLNKDMNYEKQIRYASQLEERNVMAQYIHDRLGHTISGSLMQLEAAKIYIDKDVEKSRNIIQNVIDILREGMESIRSTLKNIKPASEQLGLNRITLVLDGFSLKNNIKTVLLHTGNVEAISYMQWRVIQDNIMEALTNALKHSNATMITINIQVLSKLVKTQIKDNGKGSTKIKKGLGISGMEERTGSIGGTLIVDGSSGFSIIFLLPLDGGAYENKTLNS